MIETNEEVIARLLVYCYAPVGWDFEKLTKTEKEIIQSPERLSQLQEWAGVRGTAEDMSCPGCGCEPGDGLTDGCNHEDGCGFSRRFTV